MGAKTGSSPSVPPPPSSATLASPLPSLNTLKLKTKQQELLIRVSILALVYVLAFAIRLFSVLRYESMIHEFDPYFNYRTTLFLTEKGFYEFWNWFDSESWYPLGRIIGGTLYPGLMVTAAFIYWTLRFLRFAVHIREVCVLTAPFFASNTTIVAYFFGKEIWDSGAGLVAAALIAICPGYISRSVAGSYDNEGVAIFALLLTFYLFVKAVNTGSLAWALASAFGYFYMVSAWGGYVFIINLVPLYVLVLLVTGRYSMRLYVAYNCMYVLGMLLAMQIRFVGFQHVQSGEHMAAMGVFFLLQVGEENMVLGIGRAALEHPDVKPYVHDVLLSMALAECAIAKAAFEKNEVYEGFEALARAQYLLKSKVSLGSMPLLSQIEESLEELAPACTLELLNLPLISDNAERRRGAIAALRELLRQGLDVEASCRVQDWHCFLSQALNKLMAAEIIDLLSWENLASARKNKKLLESQNQRVVIDFDCFYLVMIAHLALGFSTRQMDLIDKAKIICECLIVSEGVDLKLEEAVISFLLGQGGEAAAFEKLQHLEINGNSSLQSSTVDIHKTEVRDKQTMYQSLEKWLKAAVLYMFPDTRECASSLENFFGGPKRILNGTNKKIGTSISSYANNRLPSFGLSFDSSTFVDHSPKKSTRHMGDAVKQLAPVSLQTQSSVKKVASMTSNPSHSPLKRSLNLQNSKFWESWSLTGDILGRIACTTFVGCVVLVVLKMLSTELSQPRTSHRLQLSQPRINCQTFGNTSGAKSYFGRLKNLMALFKPCSRHPSDRRKVERPLFIDNLSSLAMASAGTGTAAYRRQMPFGEAERLVKQWQYIKAEALGPDHQIDALSEILSDSMLSKWQDLASSAKNGACFWRFVLLSLSILRADIVLDELGAEVAEIEAVIEEAAELVNDSQPRKPSYYSTYKVQYLLRKQEDVSWRFCRGGIESST